MTVIPVTITITTASSDAQLEQILALQQRYLLQKLTRDQQHNEGFVYVEHSLPLLRNMVTQSPLAIAVVAGRVVGYCLSMTVAMRDSIPSLVPMFDQFARCNYQGRALSSYRYVAGGQVCVDREYRGQGLLARLYHEVARASPPTCELCVTEIATRNTVSIKAHQKMGFEAVSTYADAHEEWVVVVWDLRKPDAQVPYGLQPENGWEGA